MKTLRSLEKIYVVLAMLFLTNGLIPRSVAENDQAGQLQPVLGVPNRDHRSVFDFNSVVSRALEKDNSGGAAVRLDHCVVRSGGCVGRVVV